MVRGGVAAIDQVHGLVSSPLPSTSTDQDSEARVAHGSQGRQVDHEGVRGPCEAVHDGGSELSWIVIRCDDEDRGTQTSRDHRDR